MNTGFTGNRKIAIAPIIPMLPLIPDSAPTNVVNNYLLYYSKDLPLYQQAEPSEEMIFIAICGDTANGAQHQIVDALQKTKIMIYF